MRILSFDPGAKRQGWACLEKPIGTDVPLYHGSGVVQIDRTQTEAFQAYKLRVIYTWVKETVSLFDAWHPDEIACEIVPSMGFERSVQNQLAQAAITTVQAVAIYHRKPVHQLSATTVKKKITGDGRASKAKVRNGVFKLVPETKVRFKEWVKVFDESDAIAIGLTHLGFKTVV